MSNLILILLWIAPEKIDKHIREKAAMVGVAYSADVVNHVVKALYEAYTQVDTVIVFGPDFTGAGELIISALRGDCNDALRIPCEYVKNLGVTTVDLRWRSEKELRDVVDALYKPGDTPVRPRAEIPIMTPNKRHPYRGLHVLYDTDLESLRIKAIDYLLTYGIETKDVLYSVLFLQRGISGNYLAQPCDLLNGWPCGLDGADALLAAPAYIEKASVNRITIDLSVYKRDVYDPHGNFVILDKLYHYSPRGVLLRELELTEENVRREAQKVLPDHAFYLGGEFAAKRLLKGGYRQDAWKSGIKDS
ncbi:thymidylate synthase [Pyrobaculum aerophilum]|uniref:thymidylate synthase n=1 Tax=Pyrobaculum aerophilum TaxID=13773 RepID=UPI0023F1C7F2|nr:thymidylate synthase [Pyrobaculum aerophilum]MCX8137746.1 thymidylate synthase [Pyrobaculum aerophilum]